MTINKVIFAENFAHNTPCLVLESIQSSIVEKNDIKYSYFCW